MLPDLLPDEEEFKHVEPHVPLQLGREQELSGLCTSLPLVQLSRCSSIYLSIHRLPRLLHPCSYQLPRRNKVCLGMHRRRTHRRGLGHAQRAHVGAGRQGGRQSRSPRSHDPSTRLGPRTALLSVTFVSSSPCSTPSLPLSGPSGARRYSSLYLWNNLHLYFYSHNLRNNMFNHGLE